MYRDCVIQGRRIGEAEIAAIRDLIAKDSNLSRYRLSRSLCELWDWRAPNGQIQDMAARSLLLKLEQRGWVTLPPKRRDSPNRMLRKKVGTADHSTDPIAASLEELRPLHVRELSQWPRDLPLYECLLQHYHYLSYTSPVGLNLKYLVLDRHGRPLSCLLFGSAAWACSVRDQFIGWTTKERASHLQQITNNTRFLVPPWIMVRRLASHVLGLVVNRIQQDWREKYNRPLHLVETFVDTSRFQGTCYRAANWTALGQTTGRTRQDRWNQIRVAPKLVFVHPLTKNFRRDLRA